MAVPEPVMVQVTDPDPTGHGGDGEQWRGQYGIVVGLNGQFLLVEMEDGRRVAFDPLEVRWIR